jgi:hypothetical protein
MSSEAKKIRIISLLLLEIIQELVRLHPSDLFESPYLSGIR